MEVGSGGQSLQDSEQTDGKICKTLPPPTQTFVELCMCLKCVEGGGVETSDCVSDHRQLPLNAGEMGTASTTDRD